MPNHHCTNIEQAHKQAKELLRAFKAKDAKAAERIRRVISQLASVADVFDAKIALHDAQRVIANEHGFDSWSAFIEAARLLTQSQPIAASDPVLAAHLRGYEQQGFVRLSGVVSKDIVHAMRDRVWEAMARQHGIHRYDPGTWSPGRRRLVEAAGALRLVGMKQSVRRLAKSDDFKAMQASVACEVDAFFGTGRWRPSRWCSPDVNFPIPGARWTVPHNMWLIGQPLANPDAAPGVLLALVHLDRVEMGGGAHVIVAGSHRCLAKITNADAQSPNVLSSADAKRALAREEPWIRDLFSKGGDEVQRVKRFMVEGTVSGGIPLRVVELTAEPGDITLIDARCMGTYSANAGEAPRIGMAMGFLRAGTA